MEKLVAGRYRLVEPVGRGGMGAVWRAEDTLLGREVAVKVLSAPAHCGPEDRRRLYDRMRREARSAALINHPNVVVVHDVAEDDQGVPCIVMELIHGRSLGQVLAAGPLGPADTARIGRETLAALRAAHRAGVLHRDVKPGNVLLSAEGRVVLTDFGIATAAGDSPLTRTGEMVGSAGYIAPERLHGGGEPGPAADLWALGATLYRAVEGEGPFDRPMAIETAYATVAEDPRPMVRAGSLAPVIEGLLAKDPEQRLSAEEADRLLMAVITGEPTVAQWHADIPTAAIRPRPAAPPASDPGHSPADTGTGEQRGRRRRPGRPARTGLAIGLAAAAVATLAGAAAVLQGYSDTAHQTAASSASLAPSAAAIPAGYRLAKHLGVTLAVPAAWKAKERADGQQVDFIDPTDRILLRIGRQEFAGTDPVAGWEQLEKTVSRQLTGYRRQRLNETLYQGRKAAIWDFTWKASVDYRAVDLGWSDPKQNAYAIYLSAPAAQWKTYLPVFDTAVATLRTN